jgi:V/A-type H+/Na+-transporting ATPase subunit F
MKYYVIGDEDTVLGFGMVGVAGKIVENESQARRVMETVLNDDSYGIIIITECTADLIRSMVDKYIFSQSFPLILEIPSREGRVPGKPSIREMVNKAIGISL